MFTVCCCLFLLCGSAVRALTERGVPCSSARSGSRLYPARGDLDPGHCSAQRNGCCVAAVTIRSCGHRELQSCACPNNCSTHVPGQCVVLLCVGWAEINVPLCGVFLERTSLSVSEQVLCGRTFSVHVFVKMAELRDQTTGILGLGRQDFSDVTVEFLGMTPKGQSSLHVNMPDHCSFNVSSDWSLVAPGTYEIRITAAHNLTILQQSKDSLVLIWLHDPPGDASWNSSVKPKVDGGSGGCSWCLCLGPGQKQGLCNRTSMCLIEFMCINCTQSERVRLIWIEEERESTPNVTVVKVHASKQAYATNTEVQFSAVTDAEGIMEFLWHFGDSTSARTPLKTIRKRYRKPGRYNVTVVMVTPGTSATSEPLVVIIQRAVRANRLVHQASVLLNHTAMLSCRVSAGTHLSFLWKFGDGSAKVGQSTEEHVFQSVGEYLVEVTVFNLVSSASLSSHIFVVDKPCQPPAVKNMGPLTVKVSRHEAISVGVTFESEFDCSIFISGGIQHTWTLYDSMGQTLPLPHTEVQVVGSVVYSNYSVKLHVIESAPVAVIRCGTNVFVNNKNTTVVTLDATESYDPDFPHNRVRLSWACKPISTVPSSCFDHEVPTSSPFITFNASSLKRSFDQFQFTLTIESAGRSSSSDVFLTVKADLQGKVSIDCPKCYNGVNWDERFTVQAFCEDCQFPPNLIHYTWSLYQVNASSKPLQEVPFCDTVDLSAPSAIKGAPTALPLVPETFPLLPTVVSNAHNSRKLLKRHRRENVEPEPVSPVIPLMLGSGDDFFDNFLPDVDHHSSVFPPEYDQFESSSDWDYPFPVSEKGDFQDGLDLHHDVFLNVEEGESEISPGRTTVEDGESVRLLDELDPGSHREEGSNLVDVRPPVVKQEQTLLDLPRDPVAPWIFESYTFTGISSSLLKFKPFSLQPGSRYMLEVTATHNSQKPLLGRTQLFFQIKPAPKGMTCQVQPTDGVELLTVFSIFCTSGKEDLLYKYSYNVGNKPPRTLYHGTDFQHYFSLPAGDVRDDYKVTVSIEIRRSVDGGTTRPCSVTVIVQPQFLSDTSLSSDPALELSQIALRNLSSLIRLGSSVEILNYVSIVTDILKRLSLEPEANTQSLACLRNALVCLLCKVETIDEISTLDTLHALGNLLQVPEQVTLSTIREVTRYVQAISEQLFMDQKTLNHVISLLSHSLKGVSSYSYQRGIATEMDPSFYNLLGSNEISALNGCLTHSADASKGSSLAKHLVDDILHTVSLITLKFTLLHKMEKIKLSAGLVSVFATFQNQRTIVNGALSVFYLPLSFTQRLDACVVSVLTELSQNPFTWATYPGEFTRPVVELSLFRCSTRRKIPVRSLSQPFTVELQPPKNQTIATEYILQHNKINYHSFNISHEHLQHAMQIRVQFTPPATRVFPVTLLFRMFERPTPSDHYLLKTHHWKKHLIDMTLPSSFLNAAGVGYFALLNADFEKPHKWRDTRISYKVRVNSIQCLSWDGPRGAWTPHGCTTQAAHTSSLINCSCYQFHPVTLAQQHISTSHNTGDVDPFISEPYNWTVVIVLALTLCLYIGALVLSRSAAVVGVRRVHYLSDNLPWEPFLYAVTVHTGLCSALQMSAKVYLILCGENGFSQTKELQIPGCTVFKRNSQDSFIMSAAKGLGSLTGIQIWHDNSGPSPTWYLKRVEVCELNGDHQVKGRTWLFVSQCWLAVDKSDGRVERMLRVCDEKMGFAKVMCLKVWDYMADFHIWISAYSCPNLSSFTRCQRLSVCALLLLGYACVSTVIISQMDDKLYMESDIKDLSVVGITTGLFSVVLVLPAATLISFLFRLSQVKIIRPEIKCSGETLAGNVCFDDAHSLTTSLFETYFSWSVLQRWLQDSWRKKYQETDLSSVSSWYLDDRNVDGIHSNAAISKEHIIVIDCADKTTETCLFPNEKNIKSTNEAEGRGQVRKGALKLTRWSNYVAWVLWLLLCLSCLAASVVLGVRFNNKEATLWIQSLFFSLLFCIFFIHPLLIFTLALVVSIWHRNGLGLDNPTSSTHHMHKSIHEVIQTCLLQRRANRTLVQLLEVRQRIRYLRLVRPPTLTELRKSRWKRRRDNLIRQTVLDWFVFASMLFLMLCVTYGSSSSDCNHLNKAVRKHLISEQDNSFLSIRTNDDWWIWAQTTLLNKLYKNTTTKFAAFQESHILFGEPVLQKTEVRRPETFNSTLVPNCYPQMWKTNNGNTLISNYCTEKLKPPKTATTEANFSLGHTRILAESKLKQLHSEDWIGRSTVALKVYFVLYSPAPNVFTSVALNIKQSCFGVLLPSANVQSGTVFRTVSEWDYVVLACKILFLILLFLRLSHQILDISEKGLTRYCKIPCNWLEAALSLVATVYYIYSIYQTVLVSEVAELLQRQNYKTQIDFSLVATWVQRIHTLRGTMLFLLTVRCVSQVKRTALPIHSICAFFWILFAVLIGVAALSCMGDFHFQRVHNCIATRGKHLNSTRNVLYRGMTFVLTRLLWTALVITVVSLSVKSVRRRRDLFTRADFLQYIKYKLFLIWTRSAHTDNSMERKTYYFEQFESVLDELLLRLDAISDQTLPSEVYGYKQDSPISPKQDNSNVDTQDYSEPSVTQPLALFHPEISRPVDLSYLQSKDQKGYKISNGIMLPVKGRKDETISVKNTGESGAENSKGQCTQQSMAAEMVVEALIHKEKDRDVSHNVEDNNFPKSVN